MDFIFMMYKRRLAISICFFLFMNLLVGARDLDSDTTLMVKGGDAIPDGSGFFDLRNLPFIHNGSQAVFTSEIRKNGVLQGYGVFRVNEAGDVKLILRKGQATPGADGNFFDQYPQKMLLNASSHLAFRSRIENLTNPRAHTGIFLYTGDPQSLQQIIRTDDVLPADGDRVVGLGNFDINNAGQIAFAANLDEIPVLNADALFLVNASGTLTEIMRVTQQAPSGDRTFEALDDYLSLNERGQVAFIANYGSVVEEGLFIWDGVNIKEIAFYGDLPDTDNGEILFPIHDITSLNEQGQVAFLTDLANTDQGPADNTGVFIANSEGIIEIARENGMVPGGSGKFISFFSKMVLNHRGQVLFGAHISNSSGSLENGLYLWDGDSVKSIAVRGQAAPGGGVLNLPPIYQYALNNAGQVVFWNGIDLEDEGGTNDAMGLFMWEAGEELISIVREGDTLTGVGAIQHLEFWGNSMDDGNGRTQLNDIGQVVYSFYNGFALWSDPRSELSAVQADLWSLYN